MSEPFQSAAEVEDAYYDAIDESDPALMSRVWEDSPESVCLLPMQPMQSGGEAIAALWKRMLNAEMRVDITIRHLQWVEHPEMAIHTLEERVMLPEQGQQQPPIYAINIYRRSGPGWRMLMHINSPAPPPPGAVPPGMPG